MKKSTVSQVIAKMHSTNHDFIAQSHINICGTRFFFGNDNSYEIKIADTQELKNQAYRLIYQIYLDKKFITSNEEKMWCSSFDFEEQTTTLVVLDQSNVVVGALTLVFDGPNGLPLHAIFSEELASFKGDKPYFFAEIVSLGIQENLRGSEEILTKLFNFSYLIAYKVYRASHFAITVNPRHVLFYNKKLLFTQISDTKNYEKVGGAPADLLNISLSEGEQYINQATALELHKKTLYKGFLNSQEEEKVLSILNKLCGPTRYTKEFEFV